MLSRVRSVRPTIGRMPTRAHSSIRALTGKQKRDSVPSAFKRLAIAVATCIRWLPVAARITSPGATDRLLLRVGLGDPLLPEPLRAQVMLQDFLSLSRVIELDTLHAFARPVEEEPGGGFADA